MKHISQISVLAFLGAYSCVGFDSGVEVQVQLRAPEARADDGIQEALLNVDMLELIPCGPETEASLLDEMSGLLGPGVALAHGGEGSSIDLRLRNEWELDRLRPMPNTYCALELHLGDEGTDGARVETLEATRVMKVIDVLVPLPRPIRLDVCEGCDDAAQITVDYDPNEWTDATDFVDAFHIDDVELSAGI